MNTFKITLEDGDYFTTGFNGTLEQAKKYYLDVPFNIGITDDRMKKVIKVEQL